MCDAGVELGDSHKLSTSYTNEQHPHSNVSVFDTKISVPEHDLESPTMAASTDTDGKGVLLLCVDEYSFQCTM